MMSFALRRLAIAVPTLFAIVAATFFMMRIAPGGPFDDQRKLPPEIEMNMKRAYDLEKPLAVQFAIYVRKLLRGDLGPSFKNRDFSVSQLIALGAPVSIRLGLLALMVAVAAGMAAGAFSALRRDTASDHVVMTVATVGIVVPSFVVAPILILVFALGLHWLPAGAEAGGTPLQLILPVVTLALPQVAIIARLTRASVLENLRSNFVRTARAKGIGARAVFLRHIVPAALVPLVNYLAPAAASLMTGSLVVERIFGLPGIGRYFVEGAINRDYTLVMGVVIVYAALIVVLNLAADIVSRWLDPRTRAA